MASRLKTFISVKAWICWQVVINTPISLVTVIITQHFDDQHTCSSDLCQHFWKGPDKLIFTALRMRYILVCSGVLKCILIVLNRRTLQRVASHSHLMQLVNTSSVSTPTPPLGFMLDNWSVSVPHSVCTFLCVCVCVRLCGYEDLCSGRCGLWSLNCMLWQNLFIWKVKISKDVTWKQQTYHMRDLSRFTCEFMRWGGRTLTKKQNLFLVNTLQNSLLSWQFFLICTVWQF